MASSSLPLATPPAPAPQLTLEEYLHTAYHPDCDFVDGHLEERTMGGTKHSLLQAELAFWFRSHRDAWRVRALCELRTQVSPARVRLPDVSVVFEDDALRQEIRLTPPLIAIELLSPEDRLPRVLYRLEDFRRMGVPHIWLIDPEERTAYTYAASGLKIVEGTRIAVHESPIYLDLNELFAALP